MKHVLAGRATDNLASYVILRERRRPKDLTNQPSSDGRSFASLRMTRSWSATKSAGVAWIQLMTAEGTESR